MIQLVDDWISRHLRIVSHHSDRTDICFETSAFNEWHECTDEHWSRRRCIYATHVKHSVRSCVCVCVCADILAGLGWLHACLVCVQSCICRWSELKLGRRIVNRVVRLTWWSHLDYLGINLGSLALVWISCGLTCASLACFGFMWVYLDGHPHSGFSVDTCTLLRQAGHTLQICFFSRA